MSLLSQQLATFRREHQIPEATKKKGEAAPSILFSPKEARQYDADSFAALAIRGIKEASALDPDIAASEPLFTGPWRDRDTLTKVENERIDQDVRRLLLLLAPHLLTQAAQEVVEGLLQRYHVHHYNVEELLACALPYHDSPFFTRLVQGALMEGNPRWGWLQKIKEKPATLVRSALAKHCSKNLVVLTLIGQHVQEVLQLQKAHRALATFFVAIWLSTLAAMPTMSSDTVEAAVPTLIAMLRRPHLRDSFHAALAVLGALCVKADLDPALQLQMLKRVTKQLGGERARPAAALLAFLQQLQVAPAVTEHLARTAATLGPQEVLASLPKTLDCSNCLAAMIERGLFLAITTEESEEQQQLAMGLLNNAPLVDLLPGPLALAAFQAVGKACIQPGGLQRREELVSDVLQGCVETLGQRQPAALGAACRQAVAALNQRGHDSKALLQLLSPAGGAVAVDVVQEGEVLPLIEAFAHSAVEVRLAAVRQAAEHLGSLTEKEASALPQQKIYVGLLMEAVDDRSVEVAEAVLKLEGLWSSSPQVPPGMAARVLLSALEALCGWNSWGSAAGVREMLSAVLLEEARPARLVPLLIQCVAQVYTRADCDVEVRSRIDAAMLPLVIFCIVAMGLMAAAEASKDEAEAKASSRVRLRAAVLDFASASQQALLKGLKGKKPGGTKELSKAAAKAVDFESAVALCNLVQGKAWPAGGSDGKEPPSLAVPPLTKGLLAGAGAQAAAAAILGAALLRVAQDLAPGSPGQAERLLVLAAEAWEKMALHQSILHAANGGEGRYLEQSRQLLQAVLACVGHLAEAGVLSPGKGPCATALRGLLRRVLEQAQTWGPELRGVIVGQEAMFRPAILRLALTDERVTAHPQAAARCATSCANALLLLRSLITRGKAAGWMPDQSFLLALVGRLASAAASEVRRAVLATIEVLQEDVLGSPLEAYAVTEAARWSSPCAVALREAQVLREASEVMTVGAWNAGAEQELVLTGMPPKALALFIETLLEHEAEIVQDPASVATAMAQFFKAVNKSVRLKACAFWSVGACVLGLDPAAASLLGAIPAAGVLTVLSEPLRLCAKDAVAALRKQQVKAGAPSLLRAGALALQAVPPLRGEDAQTKQQARAAAAAEEALASFAQSGLLPLCSCLSDAWELPDGAGDAVAQWQESEGEPGAVSLVECFRALCSGLGCFIARHASEELKAEATAELFRLCVAAQLPSPIDAAGGEDGAAPTSIAQVIAVAANRELDQLRLDAKSLHQLVSRAPSLEGALLASELGRVAAEVLGRQVAALSSSGLGGASALLTKLGSMAKDVAAQQSKSVAAPSDEAALSGSGGALPHLLSAVAALCEHLGGAASVAAGPAADLGKAVPRVCSFIAEACKALRQQISASMLAAMVRACGALALLAPATEPVPAPLQTCVEAMKCYARPLTPDVLILLQGGLKGLWLGAGRSSELPGGQAPQEDMLAQGRLRILLHTIAGDGVLLQELDKDSCLGLARSAGLWASLDFVMLLFLRRKRMQPSVEKKRRGRKRRGAAAREEAFEEELLGAEALAPSAEEAAVDEAMGLLMSVPPDCRYHCFGTFLQTLCALASELVRTHEAKLPELPWGQGLLPHDCRTDIFAAEAAGNNQAPAALLDLGLGLASRFLTEHGLPGELDSAEVPFNAFRTTAMPEPLTVCSISYAAWASCLVMVLLERGSVAEAEGLALCSKRASELFGMFVRSLAVNHLVTFFRVAGLVLQIPERSPVAVKGDLLAKPAFASAAAACFLRVAGEALQVRQKLDAAMEEEVLSQCSPLCTAATRHVSQRYLGGAASVVVAWRFLDGLCLFFGDRDPQPVLELCLPAAAAALGEYAADEDGGAGEGSDAATSCCSYIQTAVKQLGRGILERLNVLVPPLLELVRKTQAAAEKGPAAAVGEKALLTLQVLVRSVGAFLSPFLERVVGALVVPSPAWRMQILEELGKDLVEAVPQRLLLTALKAGQEAAAQRMAEVEGPAVAAVDAALVASQRLAVMQIWIYSKARPEAVAEAVDSILQMLLQLLAAGPAAATALLRAGCQPEELPGKLLRQRDCRPAEEIRLVAEGAGWSETGSEGNMLRLQVQSAAAFTQFALRLDLDMLKPRFLQVLSWSRHGEEHLLNRLKPRKATTDEAADTEDACRALALAAVMRGLVSEAPGIAEEMLLPLTSQDLGSALAASRSCALRLAALHRSRQTPKKRPQAAQVLPSVPGLASRVLQDFSWWWFDVARLTLATSCELLAPLRTATSQSPAAKAASEALLDPCAALLDIFEFLLPSDESPLAQALLQALQGTFVELAAIADGGAGVKTIFTTLLRKSASDDPEVRLCTVRCCHKVWLELGVQVVTGLTEVVTFSSELLEDEDSRVEEAVRAMIRTVEECTGESLQESLKR